MDYRIVIPARLASERLPGKPLAPIGGQPLIQHVYARARESAAQSVIIATDAPQIQAAATAFGARVVMTSADHRSGSDRIAECADRLDWPDDVIVVNLQGDEPMMPAQCLDQVATLLAQTASADVASLYWPIEWAEEVLDPNVVKVVVSAAGQALYFSRSAIPHPRDSADVARAMEAGVRWLRHVGLYAYRAGALRAFSKTSPTPLESAEKLEQLRFLESGHAIVLARACAFIPPGVDTPEDLERVREQMSRTA